MQNKIAMITGISGQDGYYLSQLLIDKGYTVYGMVRRLANRAELGLNPAVQLVEGDLGDSHSISKLISEIKPDEFYNLAAQSHVGTSFQQPEYTADITGVGVLRILEAIRCFSPKTKFYQASTSELFGDAMPPQNESTPFQPRSPYAAAKAYAHYIVKVYRESYGLYACAGILFNHESPKRSKDFVTRKITSWIGDNYWNYHYLGNIQIAPLELGNLDAKRDWGSAQDYVEAMYMMLQQKSPTDYVIGTGETHSVREFCELAFKEMGINLVWEGLNENEVGKDADTGTVLIKVNPKYYRPAEVPFLLADPSLAYKDLGWKPTMAFPDLVKWMVHADTKNKSYHSKAFKATGVGT